MKVIVLSIVIVLVVFNAKAQNYCLELDGVDDFVLCDANPAANITDNTMSIEAWICPTAFDDAVYRNSIVGADYWGNGVSESYVFRFGGPNGDLDFTFGISTGAWYSVTATNVLQLNKWQHVAVVYDGSYVKIYVDGVEKKSQSVSYNIVSATQNLNIGRCPSDPGGRLMNGKIDELRIWNDARTLNELQENMYTELNGDEQGLVAYYPFNETSGTTTADASVNSGTGTLYNMDGSEWEPSPVLHSADNCLEFDGVNDYVDCGTMNLSGTSVTLECWVKLNNFNDPGQQVISLIGTEQNGNAAFLRLGDGGEPIELNQAQFVLYIGGQQCKLNGHQKLESNTWYHIAGVYDANTGMKIYINGILDASNAQTGSFISNSLFYIGNNKIGDTRYINGIIDEVRVWNTARTEAQIRQNMYRQIPDPVSETNLLSYYKFDSDAGTALTDYKNGNTGTLTNMTGTEWIPSSAMYGPKNALEFDGVDDYAYADLISSASSVLTIECMVYFNDLTGQQNLLHIDDGGINNRIVPYKTSSNTIALFVAGSSGVGDVLNTNVSVESNTWYHLAFVYDNQSAIIYVNGKKVGEKSMSYAYNLDGSDRLYLGSDFGSQYWSNIKLDEVRIWSDVRTAAEIRENMCKNLTGNETGLVAYYNFDNTSGLTLQDFSGNGNDCTCNGYTSQISGIIDWTDYEVSFRDYDAGWTDDALIGATVNITTSGKEQQHVIGDNTSTQLWIVLTDWWLPVITSGDTYSITLGGSDASWTPSAAYNTWLSTSSSDWSTASNWSLGSVPVSTDNVGVYSYSGGEELIISGTPTVHNMIISSAASPELSSNITVNGNLILESDVNLNGNTVTLGTTANLIEDAGLFFGSAGKIITTRVLDGSVTPINENVGGMGAEIYCAANLGSTVIERHHSAVGSESGSDAILRYFVINPTNNSGLNATLTFHYDDSELNGNSEAGLVLHKSTNAGLNWSQVGGSINTTANTISYTTNDFSWWTAAANGTVLPVDLVSFSGEWNNSNALLTWETASETNVAAFRVYKSNNNSDFAPIAFVPASGNSNSLNLYNSTDINTGQDDVLYYYLNEISFDGTETNCSPVICLNRSNSNNQNAEIFPNPFSSYFTVNSYENIISLKLFNYLGEEVELEIHEHGNNWVISTAKSVAPGMYYLEINHSGTVETKRILKN